MRCFIALDLPREVINSTKEIQKLIKKKKLFDGKIVEPENLHLTLKFLGDIDDKRIEEVKDRLKKIEFNEFEVELGKVGVFPSQYKSYIKVLWIELSGKGVFELQKKIDECLEGLFDKEFRFMSHITIARVKKVYDRKGFLDYLNGLKIPKVRFSVDRFFLKKSELSSEGPVYEDLKEYESCDGEYNL